MRRLAVVIAVTALAAVAVPASAQVVQITSSIASTQSWGPTGTVVGTTFWIRNSVGVNAGVTLTIQPGVVVKFDLSRTLTINGTLRAIGTAVDSIVFTSIRDDNNDAGDTNGDGNATVPAPSDWTSITFPDASPDNSRLQFCDIRFAGSTTTGALTFVSASDSVVSCVIRRSHFGIDCQGSAAPTIVSSSIEASTQTPIVLDFTAQPVFSSLVFSSSNNGYDAIGVRGGTLTGTATLPQRGATVGANPIGNVTYVLLSSLTIGPTGNLTVSPGVVIKPLSGGALTVNGALTMNGTAASGDTITITSIHDDNFGQPSDTNNNGSITAPNRGDWGRITYAQGAAGSISRCRLRFGTNGTTTGVIEMTNNAIPVSNSTISEASHGLLIAGTSTPVITNVAIQNCSSTPILMSVSANPTFTGITFLANAITALGLSGETIAVDSRIALRTLAGFTNITYYLMNGRITMQSPSILRIDPGVVIKSQLSGGGFTIDGGLVADGKPDSAIVFTSERDDLYGNPPDTNGDGSTTVPAVSNWSYIRFTGTSNDGISIVDNCRLTYGSADGGNSWPSSLWITSAAPTISNCFISRSSYGIRIDGDATVTINNCDINNCTNAPIVMSVLSNPTIATNCVYSTNGYNALALLAETLSQNATLRYRPNVGTPTFAYLPTGTIVIPAGVTLAIQPQVVLKPTSSFDLFTVNGSLNVVGSNNTTGRVVFTSRRDDNPAFGGDTTPNDPSTPTEADWGSIQFNDTAVDAQCIFRNVLFQFGGAGGHVGGTVSTLSASPRIARCEFFQNRTAMTFAGNSQPSVDSTTILNCTQLPIVASLISNPSFANITLANNQYLAFGILSETLAQNVRTRVRAIAGYSNINYALAGNVSIAFGAKWTIDPGVVIKLGRISSDPLGTSITIDGSISADGKPDSLIVFTSSADDAFGQDVRGDGATTQPAPGQWVSLVFNAVSSDTATILDHCRFRYGGYSSSAAMRFVNAGPSLTNCVFTSSGGTGCSIEGASTPSFTNCNFDSSSVTPVEMSLVSDPTFTNCQFLGNAYTVLGVIGESIAQDVLWRIRPVSGRLNMPYLLQSTLTIGLGATLQMQPGVQVKFTSGGRINVQRAFFAEGKTDSLIVFTSYRDDFYGGNSDNAGTAPNAADWQSISIEGTAIDPQVRFKNCVVRYGGSGTTFGAIRCINSSPSIDSCTIAYNAVGVSVEGSSNPSVHGSSLYANTQFAINNTGAAFCVNAEGNWWGAASGPNDNSATADLCGLGMNAGVGDRVSNHVDYAPFATTGIQNPLLGDVSLNGQVLAYDASLVLQSVVSAIVLTPLQRLVADVSGVGGVSAFDATLILQYVAGQIVSFPAASNRARPDATATDLDRFIERARGTFALSLGEAVREGEAWLVPVFASGSAPIYAFELRLEGGAAELLSGVEPGGTSALHAERGMDGVGRAAVASLEPLAEGTVATLRFPAGEAAFDPPRLAWARVNEYVVPITGPSNGPALSFLGSPVPNPAAGQAVIALSIGAREDGVAARVRIADVAGRTIRTLVDAPLPAGTHRIAWDGADDHGRRVPAGLYFVSARAGGFASTRRLIVVP